MNLNTTVSSAITIPATGFASKTVTISTFPTIVCKGVLAAHFAVEGTNPDPELQYTGDLETVYIVSATPKAPMDVPWVEVLDRSCSFAYGKSTLSDCARYCAKGLYSGGVFSYTASSSHWIDATAGGSGKFKLTLFVGTATWPQSADCRDVSSFLELCASSLGCSCSLTQGWTGETSGGSIVRFRTNPIKAIGLGSYVNTIWNFHQVMLLDAITVYDACAAQQKNPDGSAFNHIPTGWTKGDYWQKAYGASYVGLVDGYETVYPTLIAPSWVGAFVHGSNDPNTDTMLTGVE